MLAHGSLFVPVLPSGQGRHLACSDARLEFQRRQPHASRYLALTLLQYIHLLVLLVLPPPRLSLLGRVGVSVSSKSLSGFLSSLASLVVSPSLVRYFV